MELDFPADWLEWFLVRPYPFAAGGVEEAEWRLAWRRELMWAVPLATTRRTRGLRTELNMYY